MNAPASAIASEDTANADDAPFVVPAAGFFVDADVGFGHVQLPDDFAAIDTERQLRILAGWKTGIDQQVQRTLVRQFRTMFPDDSVPLPARLREFRSHCERSGITIPEGFVLALQRH